MTQNHVHFPRTTPAQRKLLFETWEATGSVPAACQVAHVGRGTFYYWKSRFDVGSYPALVEFADHAPHTHAHIADELAQQVLSLRQHHPSWGKRRISDEVAKGNNWEPLVSPNTVKRILSDAGLWSGLARAAGKKKRPASVAARTKQARQSTSTSVLCR